MNFCALLAIALLWQPGPDMLRRMFEAGLARREKEFGLMDRRTAAAARDLGLFLRAQGDTEAARKALAEALSIDGKVLGLEDRQTLTDAADLASVSPPDAADALWQRAANSRDVSTAAEAFAALGEAREQAGDRGAAVVYYRNALKKEETVAGRDAPRVAVRLTALALVSEPATAVPLLERAVTIDRKSWGESHPETATAESNLSGELLAVGRIDESVRFGDLALKNFEATLGPEHPRTAAAASNLADALHASGDDRRAERLYRWALAVDERAYGADNPETMSDVKNLADFLSETGRAAEAAELGRRLAKAGRR